MAAAEVDAVALEELELLGREHKGLVLGVLLEAEQALETSLEVVAKPNAADARGTDLEPAQAKLFGDPLRAVRGVLQGVGEDLGLDFRGDAVGVGPARPATLLYRSIALERPRPGRRGAVRRRSRGGSP